MLRLAILTTTLTAALAAPVAADDTCSPSRVMVVLDKSSSMETGTIAGATKWNIAVDGLGQVLNAYQMKAEFGLMTFPQPNQCSPGGLDVAPALGNRTAILGALSEPPPDAGNYTPMAQTLDVAGKLPELVSTSGARHVILVTDGWQWCSPYDPATRFDGVDAVSRLQQSGITTWIVGFGGEVDTAALNQMAMVAGTAKPNCDVDSNDPAAPNNCYFQVDDAAGLVTALSTIASNISDGELCDGIDNDCDGQVDEDLTRDCTNACGAGTETCQAGVWVGCTAPVATPETCDGEDNDCDGQIDNAGVCTPDNPETGPAGMHAGCTCEAGGAPLDAAALAPFGALGLMLFGRRRRRRK